MTRTSLSTSTLDCCRSPLLVPILQGRFSSSLSHLADSSSMACSKSTSGGRTPAEIIRELDMTQTHIRANGVANTRRHSPLNSKFHPSLGMYATKIVFPTDGLLKQQVRRRDSCIFKTGMFASSINMSPSCDMHIASSVVRVLGLIVDCHERQGAATSASHARRSGKVRATEEGAPVDCTVKMKCVLSLQTCSESSHSGSPVSARSCAQIPQIKHVDSKKTL